MSEGYSSDEGDVPQQQQQQKLSKKEQQEIERRRLKNKKKKESKKRRVKEDEPLDPGVDGDILGGGGDVVQEVAQPEDKEIKTDKDDNIEVEIEYVGADPELDNKDPNFGYFASIFNAFKIGSATEVPAELPVSTGVREIKKEEAPTRAAISEKILQEEMSDKRKELEEAGAAEPMSKRKLRLSMQPSIAKLKEITHRPDVVEWADVTSRDPFLLVALKAYRNTVPVPRHWNRGFERAPFELPDFIRRTGIQEMRESMWEKQDHQSLKSKMRERARPKLGKIDIDYQKLHDAFFKWQTKPMMTKMGELYFEGKELEAQMRDKKPGELSDELRIALGMPNAHKFPPPWLIAMQRYGPPPSYPNLKIPGLNAPIPENCSFGYHAGGWGKPPVDEFGKPLYGDVFGLETPIEIEPEDESVIERRFWGEIGSDEEESDSDVESEPEEREDAEVQTGFETPHTEGLATPSGLVSGVPTGVETPDTIELRKKKQGDESVAGDSHGVLYQVLPEKRVDSIRGQMMASTHVYEINKKVPAPSAHSDQGVEVSLNPDDVDDGMDQKGLEKHYEEHLRKQQRPKDDDGEDFSDMVAEHSAKQNRKRKAQEQKKTSSSSASSEKKKYKDFKF